VGLFADESGESLKTGGAGAPSMLLMLRAGLL